MKQLLLVSAFIIVCTLRVFSTNVSGAITSSTTWNTAGSPYIVTSSITINSGVTLTIQSGVTVQFNDGFGMTVLGTLDASGVIFTSSSASPTAGKWSSLTIGNTTNKGVVSLNSCQLSYGQYINIIRGGLTTNATDISNFQYYGVFLNGYAVDSATASLSGGTINNIGGYAIGSVNGVLTASNVNLSNAQYGLYLFTNANSSSSISGGIISAMSSAAVKSDVSAPLTINGITMNNCSKGIDVTNGNINATDITMNNCLQGVVLINGNISLTNVIINNGTQGLYLGGGNASLTGSTVTGCTFPVIYGSPTNLTLNGNTNSFSGNTNKYVYMNHTSLSSSMILPTISLPYYFPNGYTIYSGGRLQISDDNILKFNSAGINVYQGKLIAEASIGSQIYFTSFKDDNLGGDANGDASATAPAMNQWSGIDFPGSTIDSACILRRVTIKFADRAVDINSASPTLDSCTFSVNYHGVYVYDDSYPIINGCTFGSSGLTPIAQTFDADPVFTGNIFSFQDNQYDAIGLIGSSITANAVLKIRSVTTTPNVTYVMLGDITIPIGKSLTINKGVVIKSPSGYKINVQGALFANGSNDSNIVMTSVHDDNAGGPGDTNKNGTQTSPTRGDFGGIVFAPGSSGASIMNYCDVRFANLYQTYYSNQYQSGGAITMVNVSPTISNCKITSSNIGIMCYQASNPVLLNNQIVNSVSTPIAISVSANPTFTNNTFVNAGLLGLGIIGETVTASGTLTKRNISGYTNITYVLLDNITIANGTNVEIEAGVVIKCIDGRAIFVDGGFRMNGTPGSRIIITTVKDDNVGNPFDTNGDGNATVPSLGNWAYISYNPTSDDGYSFIRCSDLKFAGYSGSYAVRWNNAAAAMDDCLITNTAGFGLRFDGNSNPIVDSVRLVNGNSDPIGMSLTSDPTFSNITFTANATQGIRIVDPNLSANALLKKRSLSGISNIAYFINHLTIDAGATLTIQPGVVIKSLYEQYWNIGIVVNGGLICNGTNSEKIIFTSSHDDSNGGDYNNNGNNSAPAKSQWQGIQFNASAQPSSFKNCEFRYGGGGNAYNGVLRYYSVASNIVLDSSTIEQSSGYALGIYGSSACSFNHLQLINIDNAPVHMSMFSEPVFGQVTLANVRDIGLSIISETYSQNDTIPMRDFAGYTNITYITSGNFVVNAGTVITIPKGIVFKGVGYWTINGKLDVLGTASNPVVFTSIADDAYGNPLDSRSDGFLQNPGDYPGYLCLTFSDISDDSSVIRNALFRNISGACITLNSASPTIDSCSFYKATIGLDLLGVSQPVVSSCTFSTGMWGSYYYNYALDGYAIRTSILSYPRLTSNNTISGRRTIRGIAIRNETLSQDVLLPKRTFAGIPNIPYVFEGFTVGTGAVLTIAPGVVCKFRSSQFWVNRGLIAEGGMTADSQIVFTHLYDDFYGGDTYADSSHVAASAGSWGGIYIDNQALNTFCKFQNIVVRYAQYGIQTVSKSPSISNSLFRENNTGLYLGGSSNPTISNCDFVKNTYYGINNVDKTFVINALNCWWGNNTGPTHSGNVGGTGDIVTDAVLYSPFRTIDAQNPIMGDVSLNGQVQAYDAALILQNAVSLITFNTIQNRVGDVSATAGITAFDASLVLQYVVGQIKTFPAEELFKTVPTFPAFAQLNMDNYKVESGSEIEVPIMLNHVSDMKAFDLRLEFDPTLFEFISLTEGEYLKGLTPIQNHATQEGKIVFSAADINDMQLYGRLFTLKLKVKSGIGQRQTKITVTRFLANEDDMIANCTGGTIDITEKTNTGLTQLNLQQLRMYPNPFANEVFVPFGVNEAGSIVKMTIYTVYGEVVYEEEMHNTQSGVNGFVWKGTNKNRQQVQNGNYIITLQSGDDKLVQRVVLMK